MLSFRRKCVDGLPKTLPGSRPSGRAQECPGRHTLQVSVLVSRGGCSFLLPLHFSSRGLICKMGWFTACCSVGMGRSGASGSCRELSSGAHLFLFRRKGFALPPPTACPSLSLPVTCKASVVATAFFCELSAWGQRMYFA